ncbi:SpoIID/LytB domain-containing protein [Thermodesulfobacteriota bacterium]
MQSRFRTSLLVTGLIALSVLPFQEASASLELRVLLETGCRSVRITGKMVGVTDSEGREYLPGDNVTATARGINYFSIRGFGAEIPGPITVRSRKHLLSWDNKPLRGALELSGSSDKGIDVINVVDLEDYLFGVVNSEISSSWPEEAVKAQVVAARTYAVWKTRNSRNSHHVRATTLDQVYGGAQREDSRAIRAVNETRGLIMTHQDQPILAYYHSCCGGHTDSAKQIKQRNLPCLEGVACQWCRNSPKFHWDFFLSRKTLARSLAKAGIGVGSIQRLLPTIRTPSGRILELHVLGDNGEQSISGETLRKVLGYTRIKSTILDVSGDGRGFQFRGKGYGHGIGACQWGMRGMAEEGYSWVDILRHYYVGAELTKIY